MGSILPYTWPVFTCSGNSKILSTANTLEKFPNKSSLTETCTQRDTRDGHCAQLPTDLAYLHLLSALS